MPICHSKLQLPSKLMTVKSFEQDSHVHVKKAGAVKLNLIQTHLMLPPVPGVQRKHMMNWQTESTASVSQVYQIE